MALSFASSPGNLFNRIGKLGLLVQQMRSYQNSQNTNFSNTTNGVVAQYNAEPDLQALVGSSYISQLDSAGSVGTLAQTVAADTVNRMVFRDNPRNNQTLSDLNVLDSLQEVIRQMKGAGASILSMTIAASPSSFSGTGNGVIVASVRRPSDGLVLENSFAETFLVTCSNDSFIGGTTAGNESFNLTGTGKQSNVFAFNWPLGSGFTNSLSAIDGNQNNSSGNILTNSGFSTFVSNVPSNWSLITGAGGTDIFQENSIVYDNTGSSLRITGISGGTLVKFKQRFNNSSGTSGALDELTQYGFNIFLRRDGTAAAAGNLVIDLVDQNETVINDANGTANTLSIDLTALTTNWAAYNTVFRTPTILPTQQWLRFRLTTALTNGRSVYLDKASLGLMTQTYVNGPFVSVHSGSNNFIQGDFGTVAVTNSRGSSGTLDTFQTLLFRLFPEVESNELLFPSSAVPTIGDSLIG